MTGNLEFQYPWLLALLALLPIYAFLRGRIGKLAALRFPSADIARAAGAAARAASGRLLLFLRLLTVALCIVALADRPCGNGGRAALSQRGHCTRRRRRRASRLRPPAALLAAPHRGPVHRGAR